MKNLTRHTIEIILDDQDPLVFEPTGMIARTTGESQEYIGDLRYIDPDGKVYYIPVMKWKKDRPIKNLPEPNGTALLTSGVVGQLLGSLRQDVFVPNTSPNSIVRGLGDNVIGVRSLITHAW